MRLAISRRRTVVKSKFFIAFVFFNALFKNLVVVPEFDYFFFSVDEIERRVYFFIHIDYSRKNNLPRLLRDETHKKTGGFRGTTSLPPKAALEQFNDNSTATLTHGNFFRLGARLGKDTI